MALEEAKICAKVVGFDMGSDAYHATLLPDDGAAARSMIDALRDAGITPA